MISREELLTKLQLCVDDPMWPDHVEMPKRLIRIVIEQLTRHAQCAPRHVEALEVCKVGFQNLISLTEQTDIEIRDVCLQKIDWALCSDCPPIGYSTDKTRCDPCPRRDTALTSTPSVTAQGAPTWPSDGDMLDLLIASGYDAEQVHPTCYRGFGWKTFTEKLKAAVTSTHDMERADAQAARWADAFRYRP